MDWDGGGRCTRTSSSSSLSSTKSDDGQDDVRHCRGTPWEGDRMDRHPEYVAECIEDRDALRIVFMQLCAGSDTQYGMNDVDEESCQRMYRLMENLSMYFSNVLNHVRQRGHGGGYADEASILEATSNDADAWEKSVVHVCLVEILPGMLHKMMRNSCGMLHVLPTLLLSWSTLCATLLCVRQTQMQGHVNADRVSRAWSEISICFGILYQCMDGSNMEDILCGTPEARQNSVAVNASHIVLEIDDLGHDQCSSWVDVGCRQMTDAHHLRMRYFRACILDRFASDVAEGYMGGMDYMMEALKGTGFECIESTHALMKVLYLSFDLLSETVKQSTVLPCTLDGLCDRLDDALKAPDFPHGVDGWENVSRAITQIFSTVSMVYDIAVMMGGMMSDLEDRISRYEMDIVERLFESKNVSHQLLAVTSLSDILEHVNRRQDIQEGSSRMVIPRRIQWLQSSTILEDMLQVNLHHLQYIGGLLSLLDGLVLYHVINDRHTRHLWEVVEDDGAFEEIKSNVSHLLGFLAARMPGDYSDVFCQKLQDTKISASTYKFVEEMMTSAAKYDRSCHLLHRLMKLGTRFALEYDLPDGLESCSLLLNLYKMYHQHAHDISDYIEIMTKIIQSCMSKVLTNSMDEIGKPLCVLLQVFYEDKLPKQILHEIYKAVNVHGSLVQDLLDGYESFLDLHFVAHCSHTSEHSMEYIMELYNELLRQVLSGSNYYVSVHQIRKVSQWANIGKYPGHVHDQSWGLLEYLVQEEKCMTFDTAETFLKHSLTAIDIRTMSNQAWACLTAYIAAVLAWDTPLPIRDSCLSYKTLIRINGTNKSIEIWEILPKFFSSCILECENHTIANECSGLLSHILIGRVDIEGAYEDVNQIALWYKSSLEICCDKIFGAKLDEDRCFWSGEIKDFGDCTSFSTILRILTFFEDLLETYDWRDGPSLRPLYSSFQEEDISFKVQFQHLPGRSRPHGEQISVDISCPRNSLVGDLRTTVSQKASTFVDYFIPEENFVLYSKGNIMMNNMSRLYEYVTENSEVYAVFTSKPEMKKCTSNVDFRLTHLLSQDCLFCSNLVSLSDCTILISGEDFPATPGTFFSDTCKHISRLSTCILLRLPLCTKMAECMSKIMSRDSMIGQGPALHDTTKDIANIKSAFLLYFCSFLCSEMNPMHGNPEVQKRMQVNVPLPLLLNTIVGGYSNSRDWMRKNLARMIIQLLNILSNDNKEDIDFVERARRFVLQLVEESLDPDSGYPSSDVYYITSTGLALVLELSTADNLDRGTFLQILLTTLKNMIHFEYDKVRAIGANGIKTLSQNHDFKEVIFKDIIVDILLSKQPSNEEIGLCTEFFSRTNGQIALEVEPIARKICDLIDRCLSNFESISGHAKCLQIALLQVDVDKMGLIESLVSRMINDYLFPLKQTDFDALKCNTGLREAYSTAYETCCYALKEQDGFYRVLLCGAFLFPSCWNILYFELSAAFKSMERIFPSMYNNSVVKKLRSLKQYCGLLNGGATCYMNATFQQLYMQPKLRKALICSPIENDLEKVSKVFEALRGVFLQMSGGVEDVIDPSIFWREFKDYDGNPVDVREHQDAYEFFTRLQDSIDEYMKSQGHEKIMYSVFGGSFIQIIEVPQHKGLRSEREEEFYQISVDVRGKKNLIKSLESYMAPETLDGENQWYCEDLGHKVDAKKKTLLKKLPESLVFHLKRFEWDFETLSRWKIKDRFEFPETIDMSPYLDQVDPSECYLYDLSGIIVHSGTAFAGHYYSYAKERMSDSWYLFDDDNVEPWDISNVEEDCFGGLFVPEGSEKQYFRSQSAYMVVYDRRQKHEVSGNDSQFLEIVDQIPSEKLKQIVSGNVIEMMKMRAFNEGLAEFIANIATEIATSISGPRAPKTQKSEVSFVRKQNQYHNEIFYTGNRREQGQADELGQAIILCLEYICRIQVYGPFINATDDNNIVARILEPVKSACSIKSIAYTVLKACEPMEGPLADTIFSAIASPYKSSREYLRDILVICLRTLALGEGKKTGICERIVSNIVVRIQQELNDLPSVVLKWKDLLGCLSDLSLENACKSVLVRHIETITTFSSSIYYTWRHQNKSERKEQNFAILYSQLILPLLRMHKLPEECSPESKDVQQCNPFTLRLSSEYVVTYIPFDFPGEDFDVATQRINHLLLSGQIGSIDALLFMKWFAWENKFRSRVMVESLLKHIQDSSNLKCLASEVAPVVLFLKMEDSYTISRIKQFVFGDDGLCPNQDDTKGGLLGALGTCRYLDGSVRAYLISIMILATKQVYPNLWTSIKTRPGVKKKILEWLPSVRNLCAQISERISEDVTFKKNWIDMTPDDIDLEVKALFDPDILVKHLDMPSSIFMEEHRFPGMYPEHNKRASNALMIDTLEPSERIECIKASDGADNREDEEVREIDLSES